MTLRLRLHELEKMAKAAGYEDYKTLLYQLYTTQGMSISELSQRLLISQPRVRQHLLHYKLPIRGKGGANNVKVVMTDTLLREIMRDGVPIVAQRLGVDSVVLYQRLRTVKLPQRQEPRS